MGGRIKIGIVGCGNSARNIHSPILKERSSQFELTACCDKDRLSSEEFAGLNNIKPYESLDSFLEHPGLELVLVATRPPSTHAEIGMAALEAGKHLLLEKPMCGTYEEGLKLISKAREKDRILTVYHNRRCGERDPDYLAFNWTARQGYFGDIRIFESLWVGNLIGADWLFDWGVHIFDQVLSIMGGTPVEVACGASLGREKGHPLGPWAALIRFKNGKTGIASMRIGNFGDYPRFSVMGDKAGCAWPAGSACIENKEVWEVSCDVPVIHRGRDKKSSDSFKVKIPFTPFYENLYRAVTGGDKVLIKPEEALSVVKVANAALESAAEQRAVTIA